jgi:hypothetical protein
MITIKMRLVMTQKLNKTKTCSKRKLTKTQESYLTIKDSNQAVLLPESDKE